MEQVPSRSSGIVWLIAVVAGVAGFAASVRSIVAFFGWVDAVAAGAILVLVLLLWLIWVRHQGLVREMAIVRARLAELRDAAVSDATVRELQARLDLAERDREGYERELFSIAIRSQRPIAEKVRVEFQIGDVDDADRTTVFHESSADDPDLPIRWMILKAWCDAPGTVARSFRELPESEAYELGPDGASVQTPMRILDIGWHDRALLGMAFFNTELTTIPRRWKWSYSWPGMWSLLRHRNSDWAEYDVRPTWNPRQRTTTLDVRFIFPHGARGPRVEAIPTTPPCVQEPHLDPRIGGPVFACHVDEPSPTVMHWNLLVTGWEPERTQKAATL